MVYGRPLTLHAPSSRSTKHPSAVDDWILNDEPGVFASQPAEIPSSLEWMTQLAGLHDILSEILHKLYQSYILSPEDATETNTVNNEIQTIVTLDTALDEWRKTLPRVLRMQRAGEEDSISGNALRSRLFGSDPVNKAKFDLQAMALDIQWVQSLRWKVFFRLI